MKRKILQVCALIFCFALLLTGCATVSNVKINGKDAYFNELQYYQGQVARVGDYLYYGNSYVNSSDEGFSYSKASKEGYLARIKISDNLSYSSSVADEMKANSTPKGVSTVNNKKLFGYQNQNMYVLGQYIYFSSANTHKSSALENDYSQVSLFRIKFDGSGLKELAKDKSFTVSDNGSISVLKGSNNKYYYVIVEEDSEEETFSIKTIQIGDKIGKLKTLVNNAKSYCLPDENSSIKEIYYTINSEEYSSSTSAVKSVNFATGKINDIDSGDSGSTTTMLGRAGDMIFYSYIDPTTKVNEVYYKDIVSSDNQFEGNNLFYPATTISNIRASANGYVFTTSSNALMYKEIGGDIKLLMTSDAFSDVLFVKNDLVYLSNSTTIKRVSTIDGQVETIVSLSETELISGQCGFDGDYIYFYSQRNIVSEDEESEETQETDSHYYMFRSDLNGHMEMLGKTL